MICGCPPAIKTIWPDFAARADKEGWPAARFLAALAEHEMAERASRRIQRHLDEARLLDLLRKTGEPHMKQEDLHAPHTLYEGVSG